MEYDSIHRRKCNGIDISRVLLYLPSRFKELGKFAAKIIATSDSIYLCEQLLSLMKSSKTSEQ